MKLHSELNLSFFGTKLSQTKNLYCLHWHLNHLLVLSGKMLLLSSQQQAEASTFPFVVYCQRAESP